MTDLADLVNRATDAGNDLAGLTAAMRELVVLWNEADVPAGTAASRAREAAWTLAPLAHDRAEGLRDLLAEMAAAARAAPRP